MGKYLIIFFSALLYLGVFSGQASGYFTEIVSGKKCKRANCIKVHVSGSGDVIYNTGNNCVHLEAIKSGRNFKRKTLCLSWTDKTTRGKGFTYIFKVPRSYLKKRVLYGATLHWIGGGEQCFRFYAGG